MLLAVNPTADCLQHLVLLKQWQPSVRLGELQQVPSQTSFCTHNRIWYLKFLQPRLCKLWVTQKFLFKYFWYGYQGLALYLEIHSLGFIVCAAFRYLGQIATSNPAIHVLLSLWALSKCVPGFGKNDKLTVGWPGQQNCTRHGPMYTDCCHWSSSLIARSDPLTNCSSRQWGLELRTMKMACINICMLERDYILALYLRMRPSRYRCVRIKNVPFGIYVWINSICTVCWIGACYVGARCKEEQHQEHLPHAEMKIFLTRISLWGDGGRHSD